MSDLTAMNTYANTVVRPPEECIQEAEAELSRTRSAIERLQPLIHVFYKEILIELASRMAGVAGVHNTLWSCLHHDLPHNAMVHRVQAVRTCLRVIINHRLIGQELDDTLHEIIYHCKANV